MTEHREPTLSDRQRALLVALADGTLRGRRRERAEALVHELPDGARLVERQRRVSRALQAGLPLREARSFLATEPAHAGATTGRLRIAIAASLATVVAVLLLGRLGDDRSTVVLAADLARLPATQPAPASAGPTLAAAVQGVRFPDWSEQFGWRETGLRRDTLNGRATKTVFYEHQGHRLAYTIVSGPPLRMPDDARVIRRGGVRLAVYRDPAHGGHDVAVFERGGRTCVLAGHVLRLSTLLKLAAWRGDGAVPA